MTERKPFTHMQVRIARMALERWGLPIATIGNYSLSIKFLTISGTAMVFTMWRETRQYGRICSLRRSRYFLDVIRQMEQYDVICGKIANDNTNVTLTTYVDGIFGGIGSEAADSICFRTEKALAVLRFDGSERVWM